MSELQLKNVIDAISTKNKYFINGFKYDREDNLKIQK